MYGGIIYYNGIIKSVIGGDNGKTISIESPVFDMVKEGDSVGCNGVCLTVTGRENGLLSFDVWPETLKRTTLNELSVGQSVHTDLPLKADEFIGGHSILGHVDFIARTREVTEVPGSDQVKIWFELPQNFSNLIPPRGCIAVDGVSLTITDRTSEAFSVSLIPETLKRTHLDQLKSGDGVNIEIDFNARNFAETEGVAPVLPPANMIPAQSDNNKWASESLQTGGFVLLEEVDRKGRENYALIAAAEKIDATALMFAISFSRTPATIACSHFIAETLAIPAPTINAFDGTLRRHILPVSHYQNESGDFSGEAMLKTIRMFSDDNGGPEFWKTPGILNSIEAMREDTVAVSEMGLPEAATKLLKINNLKEAAVFQVMLANDGQPMNRQQAQIFSTRFLVPIINIDTILGR